MVDMMHIKIGELFCLDAAILFNIILIIIHVCIYYIIDIQLLTIN